MYKEHNAYSTTELRALDAAHHLHPFSEMKTVNAKGSRIITRGEGVYIWDSEGNKILDGMSGLWCTQIGNGRQEIADAVAAQMNDISYYNTFFKRHTQVLPFCLTCCRMSRPMDLIMSFIQIQDLKPMTLSFG